MRKNTRQKQTQCKRPQNTTQNRRTTIQDRKNDTTSFEQRYNIEHIRCTRIINDVSSWKYQIIEILKSKRCKIIGAPIKIR